MLGLAPYTKRPDWWVISPAQAQSIGHSPGLQFDEKLGVWIAHRTQLPLLGTSAAMEVGNGRSVAGNGAGAPPTQSPHAFDPSVPTFGDGQTILRPHQVDAVQFMSARRGILQADGCRVGKTGACVATHDPASGPMVVIGPLATKHVWLAWFARRWPGVEAQVLYGTEYDRARVADAPLIFAHYDVLTHWATLGLNRRIGTLVFDEGHLLSNRKSKRAQGAIIMAPQAERVVVATGTPLWNKAAGLWALLNLIAPAGWGTYTDWTRRYAGGHPGAHGWQTGNATNTAEFRQRLGDVMIRRVWGELVDDLVPTKREVSAVEVPDNVLRELDMIAHVLADQTINHRTLVGEMARYRRLVGSYKAERAVELALQHVRRGPTVIWVWHKGVATTIAKTLPADVPCWTITGTTPESKREAVLDCWRETNDGVLIMSLAIGQAGIDLSHADQCIFAELDWTPAVIGQAEMRTFSPLRGDMVTYVVADHDIDRRLASVLHRKCTEAMLLGTPAADTAVEIIAQLFSGGADQAVEADLDGLAARLIARVRAEGNTFV